MWGTYRAPRPAFAWLQARPYFRIVPVTPIPAPVSPPPDALTTAQHTLAQAPTRRWPKTTPGCCRFWKPLRVGRNAPRPPPNATTTCASWPRNVSTPSSTRWAGGWSSLFAGREQLIAPSAQFFLGLSDRSLWDISRGQAADPAQIMGAFGDADDPFRPYQAEVSRDGLRFRSREGREKTYRLTETGLEARFSPPLETRIPLALSPQTRFQPRWPQRYRLERRNDTLRLEAEGGASLTLHITEGTLRGVDSSLAAIPFLSAPEDPNRELSPDFFLPFPLTVVHVSASRLTLTHAHETDSTPASLACVPARPGAPGPPADSVLPGFLGLVFLQPRPAARHSALRLPGAAGMGARPNRPRRSSFTPTLTRPGTRF